ncbi:glycerol kinase GlpK [Simiduia aestuariiviva]|uniref:Glycerol kinase n=1 Tax=Simiduia aestuariiviva TaxID=1510459 RepID=A0A839UMG8_9GAMM|nr:glycerol kinase GlpK [Simiduia aestuariiviva]MBB3168903.1 glycerol kinase [Simiduia aestuariiviva]
MSSEYLLAIDQGTTSSRALVFNRKFEVLACAQAPFAQHFPDDGWVEHDAEEIWQSVLSTCRDALQQAGIGADQVAGIGITNQRETTVVWHRDTGQPIAPAIVWQDRRTQPRCAQLREQGLEPQIQAKTGLLLDPYFSATKIQWLLDNTDGARALAAQGKLACGTIDSWLLWRLTEGQAHKTDATNASRTQLYNLTSGQWDDDLLDQFDVPRSLLPEVADNTAEFGRCASHWFGAAIPVLAMVGDQQAALLGQACIAKGQAKCTFGTGAFLMVNAGRDIPQSQHRLLTTLAYRINGESTFANEGSLFVAGAAVQWLRDGAGLIDSAHACNQLMADYAGKLSPVTWVPAFTGLGAPYWDPAARGAVFGLTRDTSRADLVVGALQSIALQTHDLLSALHADGVAISELRTDGGMTNNAAFLQCLADVLQLSIYRPAQEEMTVLGAAYLTALQLGWLNTLTDIHSLWHAHSSCNPALSDKQHKTLLQRWHRAVAATQLFAKVDQSEP